MNHVDKITSWSPFYHYSSGDEYFSPSYHTFTCPKCGSHSCQKLSYNGKDFLDKDCFWSGNYMCSSCGASSYDGKVFNYYHDCFTRHELNQPQQLTFDF